MATVRVQMRRTWAQPPALGKWDVYTGAVFDSSAGATPSATVRELMVRLWSGVDATGSNAAGVMDNSPFDISPGGSRLVTWTRGASGWEQAHSEDFQLSSYALQGVGTEFFAFPGQLGIAVGYKANVGGNPQRGRSRWWLGPILTTTNRLAGGATTGGVRMSPAAVALLAGYARNCLVELTEEGWVLVVRSPSTGTTSPAEELYVEDVFSTLRSRRPWRTSQTRLEL